MIEGQCDGISWVEARAAAECVQGTGGPHNTKSYQDPNSKSATLRKTQLCPQPSGVRLPPSVTGFLVCIKNMAAFGTREKGFMHFLQPCCL